MINLLPNEEKRQIRAARTNVILLRYLIIIALAFMFLALITGASYYMLHQVNASSQQQIADRSNAGSKRRSTTSAQNQSFEASLVQAESLLATQVSYSTVLEHLGSALPSGVVLKSLTLTANSFNQPTSLEFLATSDSVANQLEKSLQASPYFSSVTPGTVNNDSGDPTYPISITYTVTINRTIAQ